jgi:hypothetical protein
MTVEGFGEHNQHTQNLVTQMCICDIVYTPGPLVPMPHKPADHVHMVIVQVITQALYLIGVIGPSYPDGFSPPH